METTPMPARYEMSWEPKQRLWRKMRKSQVFTVSCKQLSEWCGKYVPETKEGSYQVANAWWEAKQAEIDGRQAPHPHAALIAELTRRRDWSRGRDEQPTAAFL